MSLITLLQNIWTKPTQFTKCGNCRCDKTCQEEDVIGNWLIDFGLEEQVRQRIACPEKGYPDCEARYQTIQEWEKATGKNWDKYIAEIA